MNARSARAEVRNPVLALPSFRALQSLLPEQRVLLVALLLDLQSDARDRAARSWASRKAMIAAYWSAVAVYSGHLARCLGERRGRRPRARFELVQEGFPDLVVEGWEAASTTYSVRREECGLGARDFPRGTVKLGGIAIAHVSYNGRIWPLHEWEPNITPIYDNRGPSRDSG
ncbi:hypothetical protein [Sphingopyxis bauzanensis]|jgi:hypothetical protein|uniref:hypothetical protein n=1 Tax=Sphingopyxis bauzanensis TaxID=651663 RepID=UPI0019A49988|nr:hypothetical protein [Sphingopyxis bauzanensis]GGJ56267.1 hypothetical protein GCM10011393_28110 [Sphingopyxis bauzanensis]